jgi:hypothetical protein
VPEAAIDKDSEPRFRKYEIGITKDTETASPAYDPVFTKYAKETKFCGDISMTFDFGHYL